MDKEFIVSLVSATLLSVTPLQVLSFAQAASKNVSRQEAQGSTDVSRPRLFPTYCSWPAAACLGAGAGPRRTTAPPTSELPTVVNP